MKNIFKIAALFLFLGTFTACVQDDDYSVPTVIQVEPTIADNGHEYSFASLMTMYSDNYYNLVDLNTQVPNPTNGPDPSVMEYSYLVGYVISNDRTGNFYKSIYIQDAIENPTIGFKIDVDMYDTYFNYEVGRKVYVKLNGLGFEEVNGVYSLGTLDGTSLERIPELQVPNYVLRSTEVSTIVPTETTAAAINSGSVPDGILVSLPNMQVPFADLGATYANTDNTYSVNRTLMSCDDDEEIIIRNSGFADFRAVPMPMNGAGTLTAVLSRYNSTVQLYIRDTHDLDFNSERCDPFNPADYTSIFSEDFSSAVDGTDLDFTGWTNFAEAGSRVWREETYQSTAYTELSSYGSGDASNIAWLVTPSIDMDANTNEKLFFRTAQHHLDSAANTLEVFISTDFDGTNVLTATWNPIAVDLPDTNTSWYQFIDSGLIDLSSYSGNINVAFKYTGSGTDSDLDGAYQIDDLYVILDN